VRPGTFGLEQLMWARRNTSEHHAIGSSPVSFLAASIQ
jgi:hypothetical protein